MFGGRDVADRHIQILGVLIIIVIIIIIIIIIDNFCITLFIL